MHMHMHVHMHIARLSREVAAAVRVDIDDKLGSHSENVNDKPPSRGAITVMSRAGDSPRGESRAGAAYFSSGSRSVTESCFG